MDDDWESPLSDEADFGAREAYAESFARYVAGDPNLRKDWASLYGYWRAQDQALGLRSTGPK